MNKLALYLLILILFISLSYFLYTKFYPKTTVTEGVLPPAELLNEFDPTENSPVFSILGMGIEQDVLQSMIVYPDILVTNQTKEVKVVCDGGLLLSDSRSSKTRKIEKDEVSSIIETGGYETALLSGLCNDEECTEVVRECNSSLFYANE